MSESHAYFSNLSTIDSKTRMILPSVLISDQKPLGSMMEPTSRFKYGTQLVKNRLDQLREVIIGEVFAHYWFTISLGEPLSTTSSDG